MPEDSIKPTLRAKHAQQLRKTEMCRFFLSGRCGRGNACSFAHDSGEVRHKPDLKCTSMCPTFLQAGSCDNPRCNFAHSELDLRTTEAFFKTKLCKFSVKGRCKHGQGCRFAHSQEELNQQTAAAAAYAASQAAAKRNQDLFRGAAEASVYVGAADYGGAYEVPVVTPNFTNGHSTGSNAVPRAMQREFVDEHLVDGHQQNAWSPDGIAQNVENVGQKQDRQGLGQKFHYTTVMVTNVPYFLAQASLLDLFEDHSSWMREACDFFYCPWDASRERNLGYVIINFLDRSSALQFEKEWSGQAILPHSGGTEQKRLRVLPATLQGRSANLRHFSGFPLAHHPDPLFRPLVRASPNEGFRPMEVKTIDHEGPSIPGMAFAQPVQAPAHFMQHSVPMHAAGNVSTDAFAAELAARLGRNPSRKDAEGELGQGGLLQDTTNRDGTETPEFEFEHPMSREVSSQPNVEGIMAMLAGGQQRYIQGMQPEQPQNMAGQFWQLQAQQGEPGGYRQQQFQQPPYAQMYPDMNEEISHHLQIPQSYGRGCATAGGRMAANRTSL